jgi:hypothetical protein
LKIVPFVVLVLFFVVIVVSGAKAERDVHFKFYMAEMPEFAQNASWQSFECVCQSGGDRLFHVVCLPNLNRPTIHPLLLLVQNCSGAARSGSSMIRQYNIFTQCHMHIQATP